MKALTIWQPWASLIIAGWKPYEFRQWSAPRALIGLRIAIHAGKRPTRRNEVAELLVQLRTPGAEGAGLHATPEVIAFLERVHLAPQFLPVSSVLGTATLGRPRRATSLYPDSDRADHHIWGWPLTDTERFEPPIPATGHQGFWDWTAP